MIKEDELYELGKRLRDDALIFFEKANKLTKKRRKYDFKKDEIKNLLHDKNCNRIFIGIGTEYLLKSVYLMNGFHIYETKFKEQPVAANYREMTLTKLLSFRDRTLGFSYLLDHLPKVLAKIKKDKMEKIIEGLKIVKEWRDRSVHIGGKFKKNPNEFEKVLYAVDELLRHNNEPKFIKNAFVYIELDCRETNECIRIFEVTISDSDGEEYKFWNFDDSSYFGIVGEVDEKEIIKHIKSKLKWDGYIFSDEFEYEINTKDIVYV